MQRRPCTDIRLSACRHLWCPARVLRKRLPQASVLPRYPGGVLGGLDCASLSGRLSTQALSSGRIMLRLTSVGSEMIALHRTLEGAPLFVARQLPC